MKTLIITITLCLSFLGSYANAISNSNTVPESLSRFLMETAIDLERANRVLETGSAYRLDARIEAAQPKLLGAGNKISLYTIPVKNEYYASDKIHWEIVIINNSIIVSEYRRYSAQREAEYEEARKNRSDSGNNGL